MILTWHFTKPADGAAFATAARALGLEVGPGEPGTEVHVRCDSELACETAEQALEASRRKGAQ